MAQYGAGGPSDPGLVDTIVREVKSKGLFDKFRKECHADVDTKPAYQNLQQRVVGSVTSFLGRQMWKPDLNKNQLREKMRKHIIDANYLEQGLERIVDQVVNPKVAPVFIPQVEEVFYSYIGVERPKPSTTSHTSFSNNIQINTENLLPTDLEAVSPDSVRSQESIKKVEMMDTSETEYKPEKMDVDPKPPNDEDFESPPFEPIEKVKSESQDTISGISDLTSHDSNDSSKVEPKAEIKTEETNVNSHMSRVSSLSNLSIDIPLPDEPPKSDIQHEESAQPELKASSEAESSSDSTLLRNVSPLTPVRSFNNDNSCDAQQAFDSETQDNAKKVVETPVPISTFRFTIESKDLPGSNEAKEKEKSGSIEKSISYDFKNQVNLNNYSGPSYDDSSNSNNLHIDYQSDHNNDTTLDSKPAQEAKTDAQNTLAQDERSKSKDMSCDDRRSSHKSSRSSRDSHQRSSNHSKDRRSESKHSSSDKKDSQKYDKKSSKDDHKSRHSSSSHREISKEKIEKRDKDKGADSSKDRHSSSHKSSSSHRDSKSSKHTSSSSHRHSSSSSKHSDDKKSSSSHRSDEKKVEKDNRSKSSSRDHTRHSSSHRSDKDKKSSSSKDKKDEKKDKKEPDDHYSASGRGNRTRRSTDRDSNDGNSSSSKGSNLLTNSKTSNGARDNKSSLSKAENNSSSSDTAGQSDAVDKVNGTEKEKVSENLKPVVQLESTLKTPVIEAPKLPQGEDVAIRKPMIANNMYEARKLMKLRKYLAYEEEKKRQEAALLIEVQEKIHSSVSQVFSGISGPELEFACISNTAIEAGAIDTKIFNEEKATDKMNDFNTENLVQKTEEKNIIKEHDTDVKITEDAQVIIQKENAETNIAQKEDTTKDCTIETVKNKTMVEKEKNKINKINNKNKLGDKRKINIIDDKKKETQRKESTNQSIDMLDFEDYSHLVQARDDLLYFGQQELFNSELEKAKLCQAIESIYKNGKNKLYLLNCDVYSQNLFKQVCNESGDEVTYLYTENYKPQTAKIVNKLNTKDLEISSELSLPAGVKLTQKTKTDDPSNIEKFKVDTDDVFSPNMSSDCSFDLSSDFEKKIDELVQKTSRQEIMEIILGGGSEVSSQTPKIEFCYTPVKDDNESEMVNLKRKRESDGDVVSGIENNNCKVLMPNKMRKLSLSEQISSTTEGETSNETDTPAGKSKFVGRARRVGLPKPKNSSPASIPKSPSSDKSVENYVQNSQVEAQKLNGTVKSKNDVNAKSPRINKNTKRYDTSDLYKPKLHYLSRRHNPIT